MKSVVVYLFINLMFVLKPTHGNYSCGVDNSDASMVYEGVADIETYPWLGTLHYPIDSLKMMSTNVVLVTKQIVIGSAKEIDRLPKEDLRSRSRVVLGHRCNRGPSIRVRDYTFHPEYKEDTYSALAMVQLEIDNVEQELRPICPPAAYFRDPQFYAMTLSNCKKGVVQIYKMIYVPMERCKQFYRKSGLDANMDWPVNTACARTLSGGQCTWRSGTVLVLKRFGRWTLQGFGMYGPGCEAPSRFLDYGTQEKWVQRAVSRMGMPAITRLADNYLILRRSMGNLQRFGPCDDEETKYEIYSDIMRIHAESPVGAASYNVSLNERSEFSESTVTIELIKVQVTLITDVEYSCIVIRAYVETSADSDEQLDPKLYLRRWCAGPPQICYGYQFLEINFFIKIVFENNMVFSIAAYGKQPKIIEPVRAMIYFNKYKNRTRALSYRPLLDYINATEANHTDHRWFYLSDIK